LTAALRNLGDGVLLSIGRTRSVRKPRGMDIFQRSERELLGVELATLLDGRREIPCGKPCTLLPHRAPAVTSARRLPAMNRILQLILTNSLGQGMLSAICYSSGSTLSLRRNRELTTLNELAALFTSPLHLDEILQGLMDRFAPAMRVEAGWLLLKDPETDTLVVRFAAGRHKEAVEGRRFKLDEGIAGRVFREGVPAVVPDAQKGPPVPVGDGRGLRIHAGSVLYAPLKARNSILGAAPVMNSPPSRPLGEEDLSLLRVIAAQAAMTIEHSRPLRRSTSMPSGWRRLFQERTRELERQTSNCGSSLATRSEFLKHSLAMSWAWRRCSYFNHNSIPCLHGGRYPLHRRPDPIPWDTSRHPASTSYNSIRRHPGISRKIEAG